MINKNVYIQKVMIAFIILSLSSLIDQIVDASKYELGEAIIVSPIDPDIEVIPSLDEDTENSDVLADVEDNDTPSKEELDLNLPNGETPILIREDRHVTQTKKKKKEVNRNLNHVLVVVLTSNISNEGVFVGGGANEDEYLSNLFMGLSGTMLYGRRVSQ